MDVPGSTGEEEAGRRIVGEWYDKGADDADQ